jgi:hypothetical protein
MRTLQNGWRKAFVDLVIVTSVFEKEETVSTEVKTSKLQVRTLITVNEGISVA